MSLLYKQFMLLSYEAVWPFESKLYVEPASREYRK